MARFRVDVQVYATAYVEAETKEAAISLFESMVGKGSWIEVGSDDIAVNGSEVVLSPCMTSYGFASADVEESEG